MTSTELIVTLGLLSAAYQVCVSIQLVSSTLHESKQKALQLALIWLVPMLGAVVVHAMMRTEGKPPYKPEKGYTEPGDSAS
jgi:hypothetical protein